MSIDYRLSPADTQRRIRDERDIYRNRWEAAERRIKELEAELGWRSMCDCIDSDWIDELHAIQAKIDSGSL